LPNFIYDTQSLLQLKYKYFFFLQNHRSVDYNPKKIFNSNHHHLDPPPSPPDFPPPLEVEES